MQSWRIPERRACDLACIIILPIRISLCPFAGFVLDGPEFVSTTLFRYPTCCLLPISAIVWLSFLNRKRRCHSDPLVVGCIILLFIISLNILRRISCFSEEVHCRYKDVIEAEYDLIIEQCMEEIGTVKVGGSWTIFLFYSPRGILSSVSCHRGGISCRLKCT